jgi:hypothetical protein
MVLSVGYFVFIYACFGAKCGWKKSTDTEHRELTTGDLGPGTTTFSGARYNGN